MIDYEISLEECTLNLQRYFKNIEASFDNYEERTSQKNMIRTILRSYKAKKHSMIEAPTGTGKSMAYILAYLSALEQFQIQYENKKAELISEKREEEVKELPKTPKLVIATNTIALQEQLMNKDIPMIKKILNDVKFNAVLIKGRGNYVCLRKMQSILESEYGVFDSNEEFQEFKELSKEILIKDKVILGDKSKFTNTVSLNLWDKLKCESETCLKKNCAHFGECFFYKARKEQKQADILVSNHALFFADLSVRIETDFEVEDLVLPDYDYVVFDEAHHIEDVASDFMGTSVSRARIKKMTSDIKRQITKGDLADPYSTDQEMKEEIIGLCNDLDNENDLLFKEIVRIADKETVKRLGPQYKGVIQIEDIIDPIDKLNKILRKSKVYFDLSDEEELVLESLIERVCSISDELKQIVKQEENDYVYWIECPMGKDNGKDNRFYHTSLNTCPISVSNLLKEHLFDRHESITLTSATMGTDNMSYIANRIGVTNYVSAMFHSPFDYKEQSRIYVPQNAPNPKDTRYETFLEGEIEKILKVTKGRALVLFTSYKLMNSLSEKFKPIVEKMGYSFLKQGELPRTPLITAFKDDVHSVLFATSSYWEGIDVPGESLSCVVITRLPFEVPNRPVIQARMEMLEKQGKNPFGDYQVPIAIMKFKQGFGRLIRTSSDKGVVAVLDNRLLTMNYGRNFLKSLPPIPITNDLNEIGNLLK